MSAFTDACRVEADGVEELVRFLEEQSDNGRFILTDKGRLAETLQTTIGDAVMNRNGSVFAVEFKVESKWTGNLFLETWSNRSRFNPGWMVKLDADILLYYFRDVGRLLVIPFQRLKQWAWWQGGIYRFREAEQRKYQQLNDTWGRIVSVETIEKAVGFTLYERTTDGRFIKFGGN